MYQNERLKEFNEYLVGKKVAIIGMGVSNVPLLDYFHHTNSFVTVFDKNELKPEIMEKINTYGMQSYTGAGNLSYLQGFDVIFRSPSCRPDTPEIEKEIERGAILTSEIEMVMKLCPGKIIGVTGSDGKTTTTTLIYHMIKEKGYRCFLGGNIGIPLFTKIEEMAPEDIVVLELSSFQLMDMDVSPDIAVVTNITPNHLDIHKSYQEYIDSKKHIFEYQNDDGILVLNYDNEITREFSKEAKGKVVFFSSKEKLDKGVIYDDGVIKLCEDQLRRHIVSIKNIKVKGIHNYENVCTAIAATQSLVDMDTQVEAICKFTGVEHRLEFVREIDGVEWYNDSASSSPSRAINGLNAFDTGIILIAGGYDKNLDYTPIAKPIVEKVTAVILIGSTADKIETAVKNELKDKRTDIHMYRCDSLEQTIRVAKEVAKSGEVVLFSPASASFDMFKNAYDRGNQFKELVKKI